VLGSEREPRWSDAGGGGGRGFWSRVFGGGENPLTWAIPVYRWLGISVRVHVFFIVFVLFRLLWTLSESSMGIGFMASIMSALFLLVLLHEYGHCFACRWVGGEADEVILWPLGGLAMVVPPHDWRSHLITTLGGPAVNAALLVPLAVVTWLATGELGAVVFNPLDPRAALGLTSSESGGIAYWATVFVWSLHYANIILLAINMLIPMYPMDAGRVVHSFLWRSLGYAKAMNISVIVGFATAGLLAVGALVVNQTPLLALAAFGGIVCWQERAKLRMEGSAEPWQTESDQDRDAAAERAAKAEAKREAKERAAREEIDRILAKISAEGMESLTSKERKALKRASSREDGSAGPR